MGFKREAAEMEYNFNKHSYFQMKIFVLAAIVALSSGIHIKEDCGEDPCGNIVDPADACWDFADWEAIDECLHALSEEDAEVHTRCFETDEYKAW